MGHIEAMQNLILMRHAKAENAAPSGEDIDRELSGRGLKEAVAVADALKASGLKPDLALVSASARTRGTFEQIKTVFGDIEAVVLDELYNADSHVIRRLIEANEDRAQCLLVVAHNPGLAYLVVEYMHEGAASLDAVARVATGYPTATATVFAVDVAGRPTYETIFVPKSLLGA
jgi:phosphohistidine phosphatase